MLLNEIVKLAVGPSRIDKSNLLHTAAEAFDIVKQIELTEVVFVLIECKLKKLNHNAFT